MQFEASKLRKDYHRAQLDEGSVDRDPLTQFRTWLDEAIAANLIEANAMIVATVGSDGSPSARTVLLKDIRDGGLVFTTSYLSQKGREMDANPRISALFYWPALERQVRITGNVAKLSPDQSDALFNRRPVDARISAVISEQSQVVPNREYLEHLVADVKATLPEGDAPARPETWGGYLIDPDSFEFWQGRQNRLHDRLRYRRDGHAWMLERLAP
jgi:pyridoxamine 5'-phosphate oxidase